MKSNLRWTSEQVFDANQRIAKNKQSPVPGAHLKSSAIQSIQKPVKVAVMAHKSAIQSNGGVKVDIKPISVNRCWQGRRFKTPEYEKYEEVLLVLLPNIKIPQIPYEVIYDFGMSNMASDADNPVKPLQDILQKRYGIDDKNINRIVITKTKVKKGFEYVYFEINHLS